jgi:hypothetical protein
MQRITLIILIACIASCTTNKNQGNKGISGMPPCLVTKIEGMKTDQHNSPETVTEYNYKGQPVFYLSMPCCDQFNTVYDGDCNYLGAPDGGLTGRGDGKLPDFFTNATDKKVVWKK